jgi:hypothetical protein
VARQSTTCRGSIVSRQCVIEYLRVRSSSSSGTGYQHLANAVKNFSAFPVIVLSALQRKLSVDHTHVGLSEATVYRAWLVAVLINSCLLGRGKRLGSGALLLRLLRPALALVVPIPPHHPPAQTDVPLSHLLLVRGSDQVTKFMNCITL